MSHEQLMRDYYRTYNSEDPAALAGFYHDDVVLVSAEGELRGPEAILATYRYITCDFLDQMTPTRILVDGDTAVVDITDRFTARRDVPDFMGLAFRQGEHLELALRGTYTIDGGKFRRIVIEAA